MFELSYDENILILNLLDILRKHTDENHQITQKEILQILEEEYDTYVVRKTVKQNMEKLIKYYSEQGGAHEIIYDERSRHYINKDTKEKKTYVTQTNFGYVHEFTHGELRLMIDSILFSKQIPRKQREGLIKKIESLSSKHFNSRMSHIRTFSSDGPRNSELFYTIECLDEAIANRKQVSFHYNKYHVDEQSMLVISPQVNRDGVAREYIINPYQIVTANGLYYLICNNDKYDDLSHYRLDRITNIQVLRTRQKPIREIEGQKHGLNLPKHMAEHIYMFRGESISVKLRFDKRLLSDFIDWFGTDHIHFSDQTADEVTARVSVNQMAMRKWALQYATNVRVLSPESLVDEIREDINRALENYQ